MGDDDGDGGRRKYGMYEDPPGSGKYYIPDSRLRKDGEKWCPTMGSWYAFRATNEWAIELATSKTHHPQRASTATHFMVATVQLSFYVAKKWFEQNKMYVLRESVRWYGSWFDLWGYPHWIERVARPIMTPMENAVEDDPMEFEDEEYDDNIDNDMMENSSEPKQHSHSLPVCPGAGL